MKIALAQLNYHIGNFESNTTKIIEGIKRAKSEGAELVVFSELSICGYPPRDFLEFDDFINKCYAAVDEIKVHADTIGVIVGGPQRNKTPEGKDLFNAAWFLYEGEIKQVVHKTLLPTYDVFDEYRYFEPAYDWHVVPFKGKKIALTICEDIWNLTDAPLYRVSPMDKLILQQPDLMINISASPFDYNQEVSRKNIVRENVLKYNLPMLYCNCVGSQTEIVFDGGSVVYDAKGNLVQELKYFEEDFTVVEVAENFGKNSVGPAIDPSVKIEDAAATIDHLIDTKAINKIHDALILGIRDYFSKMGFKKAILGSSGGIDSAVVLALACEALGAENVRAILMPSQYSSDHSVSDAEQLSKNLGNPYDIVPIKNIYDAFLTELKPIFKDLPFSVAEENTQSRTRGNLLMSISNKFGYILLNTSNKSELSTGYGTLYGDMAGGLSVLGDTYKVQVYALARYINRNKEIIPDNIITKAPSAELRPGQKDTDSLPEYDVLDKVLYQYIERRQGPKEIIAMGVDEALVKRILKLVNTNEYKRNQFCPIIRVSSKAFGVGRRMPIVGKYLS
ncbi:NAD+ synthase [Chitinophagaceae bacterium 26-R-25]|nr:NAD+ synthase [Chitinophagaceae bacterium 26-R-25]